VDLRHLRDDPATWQILEERARALAAQDIAVDEGAFGEEVLAFCLGEGRYCLPARSVREVYPLAGFTRLPSTPPFVVGLVNVRGHLLAALDIRPLLDIAPAPPRSDAFLLIVAAAGIEVGLLADLVVEVRRGDAALAPALSATAGRTVAWVKGVDRLLNLVLDPALLLADPRLIVNHTQE
jgi:purine-binding chemotaxis protein CheW